MIPLELIESIIAKKIEIIKPYDSRGEINRKRNAYPELWEGYNEAVGNYISVCTHAEKNTFPSHLFSARNPNQSPEEFDWMKANYKQVTLPVFTDYMNTRGRAWHKSNWQIQYKEDANVFQELGLRQYIEEDLPMYSNLTHFTTQILSRQKAKDPEGVICIKPSYIPLKEVEEGLTMDDEQILEPAPYYYNVKNVWEFNSDYALILQNDRSFVDYGNKSEQIGRIFELYDDTNIWRITQVGKYVDHTFEIQLYFNHNSGKIPVTKLKGTPKIVNNTIRYESHFLPAVDNLDLVLLDSSYLFASKCKSAFPFTIIAGNECEFTDQDGNRCMGGHVAYYDEDLQQSRSYQCPSCNGSGLKARISPLGELVYDPKNADENTSSRDFIKYVAPDPKIMEFLRKEIELNTTTARTILHLTNTKDQAQGQENSSATRDALEDKALLSFVKSIADQEFWLFEWMIDHIGWQRYGELYQKPNLIKPTTFDFTTEEDYINQLSMAIQSGAPPMIRKQILIKYLMSVYANEEKTAKVFELLIQADRLLDCTSDEITVKMARGTVQKWEDVLHTSAQSLITEIELENPDFLDEEMDVKVQALIEKAKSKVEEDNSLESLLNE